MKIRISELRKIIKEMLDIREEATPPGKWHANSGEPADDDDLYKLGEVDSDEEPSKQSSSLRRSGAAQQDITHDEWKEPKCLDCGLPGSDCECEPSGRFE